MDARLRSIVSSFTRARADLRKRLQAKSAEVEQLTRLSRELALEAQRATGRAKRYDDLLARHAEDERQREEELAKGETCFVCQQKVPKVALAPMNEAGDPAEDGAAPAMVCRNCVAVHEAAKAAKARVAG